MISNLLQKLQVFTDRLDLGVKTTQNIVSAVKTEDWAKLDFHTNNRERLFSIISREQEYIEKIIDNIVSEELTPENINIIKSWAFDTQNWINTVASMDDLIIELLNHCKDEVTKEIIGVFRSKTAFRGYNLNDVRK